MIMTSNRIVALTMPKWGLTMEEGTISSWLLEEGDKIESKDAKAGDLAQFGKDIAENLGIGGEGEKGAGKEEAKKEEEKAPEAGQIEVRQVAVKYMAPDYTEIGEGLEEGELVAVEVREELKNGSKVEISEVLEAPF